MEGDRRDHPRAAGRVSDGESTWGAIGVHENVIEASWDALVDSLEAGMLRSQASVQTPS